MADLKWILRMTIYHLTCQVSLAMTMGQRISHALSAGTKNVGRVDI